MAFPCGMTSAGREALDGLKIDRSAVGPGRAFPWGWLLLVVAVAAAGWWWWQRPGGLLVETALARPAAEGESRVLLNASGYVTARRAATVSAKVTGKVLEVLVEEGLKVAEGQVVARLDDSNAQVGLRLNEAQLAAARLSLDETRPRLIFAELELTRFRALLASRAASQSDLARAEAEVAALQARLARQVADIAVAERSVDEGRQQVDDTVIRAPFAGVVTTKDAQPGEIISPMSSGGFTRTGICTVVDMESLEIEVDVSESYLNRVQADQPAEAMLDAYAGWRIPAKVIAIIPSADRQKATVKVRLGFAALDPRILPEMGVKVAFLRREAVAPPVFPEGAVLVPGSAVVSAAGGHYAWVVREGRVQRRELQLGGRAEGDAVVAAGLQAGESVVLAPAAFLTEGVAVRAAKP